MVLREFVPSDKAEFLSMCTDFYYGGEATLEPIPVPRMERTFDRILSGTPYVKGYMMEEGGTVCGYGLVFPFYSNEAGGIVLMLDEIYVKPDYRGRKFGSQYLSSIASVFGGEVVALKLEICPRNPRARKLYESVGFAELGYGEMIKYF